MIKLVRNKRGLWRWIFWQRLGTRLSGGYLPSFHTALGSNFITVRKQKNKKEFLLDFFSSANAMFSTVNWLSFSSQTHIPTRENDSKFSISSKFRTLFQQKPWGHFFLPQWLLHPVQNVTAPFPGYLAAFLGSISFFPEKKRLEQGIVTKERHIVLVGIILLYNVCWSWESLCNMKSFVFDLSWCLKTT